MNKGETKCSCNGKNENCCRCNGWGYYEPRTIEEKERSGIPKLRSHFTSRFTINSEEPIKEHLIESKIEEWKRKRNQSLKICNTEAAENINKYYKYSVNVSVTYEILSTTTKCYRRVEAPTIYSSPEHYNSNEKNLDASRGVGYVFREQGKFGSYPMHDDYSEDSEDL